MATRFRLILLLPWLAASVASAQGLFDVGEQEFLPPDEAFMLSVFPEGGQMVRAEFRIADGYYLYRDKTAFAVEGEGQVSYQLPKGKIKDDPLFGEVQTWSGETAVDLRVVELPEGATSLALKADYQGCAERGVCYPPQTKIITVAMGGDAVSAFTGGPSEMEDRGGTLSQADQIAEDLSQKTLLWSFLVFMGFGLLLALTPCVLPMIPILASVIAGANAQGWRAFRLSLAYVLAMAGTYALLGIVIGLTGANLQAYMQNIWVIGGFVLILLLLALSMFGLYELRLPAGMTNSLHATGQRFGSGGSYIGAGVMGFLAALVASPCVSPPLVGALIHIADTGGATRGGISLFGLGLGLGVPLLLFGAFEGRFLPRSGPWMVRVKGAFGVLLLALSIWMLDRVVPGEVTLVLSGLFLLVLGVFLRAIDPLPPDAGGAARLGKGVGLALLLYGVFLLAGAGTGGDSLLRPWERITANAGGATVVAENKEVFRPVKTVEDLQRELQGAGGQPVMLDFWASWCVTCQEIETFTFPDPEVQARMRSFLLLKADVTDSDAEDKRLLGSLGLFGPPAILFYDANGTELRQFRVTGFISADDLVQSMDEVLARP